MKTTSRIVASALLAASAFISQGAFAGTLTWTSIVSGGTCSGITRAITFTNASQCAMGDGSGTTSASDVAGVFGQTWVNNGSLTANGTDGLLTGTSTGWGSAPVSGTWQLAANYWDTYGSAVISIHVGNGNASGPDNFLFWITPGQTSGSFNYTVTEANNGGGLSNMFLWTSGTPTQVPEPATLGLLGLGLAGVGFARRRKTAA